MKLADKNLEAFLKEKGVLEQYLRNWTLGGAKTNPNHMDCAFSWHDAPEGYGFWSWIYREYILL